MRLLFFNEVFKANKDGNWDVFGVEITHFFDNIDVQLFHYLLFELFSCNHEISECVKAFHSEVVTFYNSQFR